MILNSSEYLVGIPAIDIQHKQYINLINKLLEARKKGDIDKASLMDYVNDINVYALEHFDAEELLMRTEQYPLYEKHLEKHNIFRDILNGFIKEMEAKDVDINDFLDSLYECLVIWFKAELLQDDIILAKFIKNKGADSLVLLP